MTVTAKKSRPKKKKLQLTDPLPFSTFAKLVGVSKMTVYRRVTCDSMLQQYVTASDTGEKRIDRTAMRFFKDSNTLSHPVTCDSNVTVTCDSNVTPSENKILDLLQQQIEILQKQLEKKDVQIENLQRLLDQQQQLQQQQIISTVKQLVESNNNKRYYRKKGW